MKKLLFLLLIVTSLVKAQDKLPEVHLPVKGDLHFISPEPIQYVDISDKNIQGDLPLPNVLRLRFKKDTCLTDAIVTIAGEKFIAQYHVWPVTSTENEQINIQPDDTRPLDISGVGFSQRQLKSIALNLFCRSPRKAIEKTKAFGLKASLYHLYTAGDYIFIDLGYHNKTNLAYAIDEFSFKVDDKKVTKATNVQSVAIKPAYILFDNPLFQKTYRNIIVLKKMSFPGNKLLHIELSEKQLSGRVITLNVSYKDVLEADIVPL
jgi:conjugative transposon TraN protein